jgi:hypothetical protein
VLLKAAASVAAVEADAGSVPVPADGAWGGPAADRSEGENSLFSVRMLAEPALSETVFASSGALPLVGSCRVSSWALVRRLLLGGFPACRPWDGVPRLEPLSSLVCTAGSAVPAGWRCWGTLALKLVSPEGGAASRAKRSSGKRLAAGKAASFASGACNRSQSA